MEELKMFDVVYIDNTINKQGSEQDGVRPAIIIQNNMGNKHSPTVLIMCLTTSIKKNYLPTHCIIHRTKENGLKKKSMLLGETLTQISKERILSKVGTISDSEVQNDILNVYLANITGRKKYNSVFSKILNKIFTFSVKITCFFP
mgnify:CR=1 FL=1